MRFAALALVFAAGCIRAGAFECSTNAECTKNGEQGTCEAVRFCAFPDPSCTSGARYGDLSGAYSNKCVGDEPIDAGTDGSGTTDGPSGGCPSSYQPLSGAAHVYRLLSGTANWNAHKATCAADSAAAHLAIPANASELGAFATLAGTNAWIGIDDMAIEGTYVTVTGAPAMFLPWGPGEPDNPGNQDCVEMLSASQKIATLNCNNALPAICECLP